MRRILRAFKSLVLFVLAVVFSLCVAVGIFLAFEYYAIVKDVEIPSKESLNPKEFTSKLYLSKDNSFVKNIEGAIKREYVRLEDIPINLQNAVIATEDKRFFEHFGVDIKASFRALVANIKGGEVTQGASTITQQLVKLNVLKDSSVKLERKLKEQFIAIKLENKLEKELGEENYKNYILEAYLNSITFGNGIYGVSAACEYYFDKDISDLTLTEASILASIISSPSSLSPDSNFENNAKRRKLILHNMLEQNMINQAAHDKSLKVDLSEQIAISAKKHSEKSINSYYEDQVIEQVHADLVSSFNLSDSAAFDMIYNGGLQIYSAMEADVQEILDETYADDDNFPSGNWEVSVSFHLKNPSRESLKKEFKEHFRSLEDADAWVLGIEEQLGLEKFEIVSKTVKPVVQPQSAFIILNNASNTVSAVIGGRGEKTENRSLNRAVHSKRQPGSVFKVLAAYAPALDTSLITSKTVLVDEAYTIGGYSPRNWNGSFRGATDMKTAIAQSINVLAVKTLVAVGYDVSFRYLRMFGFTSLVVSQNIDGQEYTDKNPVLALGGLTEGVSLIELTAAFETIANKGIYQKPYFYTKVLNKKGAVILKSTKTNRLVLKRETASDLTEAMIAAVNGGTGSRARIRMNKIPVAGKTGTTSETKDLLFVGFSPYYTAGIWIGNDLPSKMRSNSFHLSTWRIIMERVHENLPEKEFEIVEPRRPNINEWRPETTEETSVEISDENSEATAETSSDESLATEPNQTETQAGETSENTAVTETSSQTEVETHSETHSETSSETEATTVQGISP